MRGSGGREGRPWLTVALAASAIVARLARPFRDRQDAMPESFGVARGLLPGGPRVCARSAPIVVLLDPLLPGDTLRSRDPEAGQHLSRAGYWPETI